MVRYDLMGRLCGTVTNLMYCGYDLCLEVGAEISGSCDLYM
jgi:hypothetical protein